MIFILIIFLFVILFLVFSLVGRLSENLEALEDLLVDFQFIYHEQLTAAKVDVDKNL